VASIGKWFSRTSESSSTLSSINPNTSTVGASTLTIVASGSGLIPASVIEWNGVALTTTFNSAASLQAQIPASDLSKREHMNHGLCLQRR
jgi:hypothetical protein